MVRASEGFYCKGACHTRGVLCSFEVHHVWPKEFHGPSIPSNLVTICPNCHSNAHDLLNKMLRSKPNDPNSYSLTERRLAARGYAAVMAYGESLVPK